MLVSLRSRETAALERMDLHDADHAALRRTYRHFRLVNRLLSGWRRIYRTEIRPLLSADRNRTLLDIGCGGGDLARAFAAWAAKDGLLLQVTAIDPDPRAYEFASALPAEGVTFRRTGANELVSEGQRFDIVTSNHVLHHLVDEELGGFLADSEALSRRLVLHSDLARSRLAYLLWAAVSWPVAGRSFLHHDGLLSIRRSYQAEELAAAVPAAWRVRRRFPARLLLVRTLTAEEAGADA